MIIRLLRASLAQSDRPALVRFLRSQVLPGSASTAGLVSFHAGLRDEGDRSRFAFVGVWDALGELASAVGDFDRPRWLDQLGVPVKLEGADLYELAGRSFPGIGQIRGEVLRIFTARVRPNAEAVFHERLRVRQEALAHEDALLALHVGRRIGEGGTDVIAVAVWRDADSVQRLSRADFVSVPEDPAADWITASRLDTYEAIDSEPVASTVVPP